MIHKLKTCENSGSLDFFAYSQKFVLTKFQHMQYNQDIAAASAILVTEPCNASGIFEAQYRDEPLPNGKG